MSSSSSKPKTTALEEITLGGLGAMGACTVTNPLEVIKVRIQLQGELLARGEYTVHYRNVLQAFYAVASTESMRSLQKGLVPALCYQFLMNGCRFGAYQAFDNAGFFRSGSSGGGDVILSKAILASSISGGAGTWFGNPFYLIKCHLQSRSDAPIAVGHQHGYARMRDGFREIYAEQGVRGFWTGGSAALLRGVVCGSVQMTTFTVLQSYFVKSGIFAPQSWTGTMTSTVLSSCALCLVSNPVDVISTRLCNQEVNADTRKGVTYRGITDCALKMYQTEGLYGFYKGFTASVIKNGPHTALALFFWQVLRKQYVGLFKSEGGGGGGGKGGDGGSGK